MAYSPEQILAAYERLHRELRGSDREVSIAKITKTVAEPFSSISVQAIDYTTVTPLPRVTDTPDEEMLQKIGRKIGTDEKVFTFVATSLVARDPVATLGERVEALLAGLTGQGRGAIRHGTDLYTIEYYFAGTTLIGVVPQWHVVAKVMR